MLFSWTGQTTAEERTIEKEKKAQRSADDPPWVFRQILIRICM